MPGTYGLGSLILTNVVSIKHEAEVVGVSSDSLGVGLEDLSHLGGLLHFEHGVIAFLVSMK